MIVDANVLLYAVDVKAQFHEAAYSWLSGALNGVERVGMPWQSLLAFQRIITHPRITANPLTPDAAWSHVDDWLAADLTWVPNPGSRHREILTGFLADGILRGNLVSDAHLAAIAIEHGVGVCSFDSDFARFKNLNWFNPAQPG